MVDNSLATLLTNPWVLGALVALAFVCFKDVGRRKQEVAEYEADPAAYRELQKQGKRR